MDIAIINLNSEIGSSLQTPRKFDNGSELSHFLVEKTSKSWKLTHQAKIETDLN